VGRRSLLLDICGDGPFSFVCDIWIVLKQILCVVVPFLCPEREEFDPPTSTCPLWQNPINSTPQCTRSTTATLPVCVGARGNGQRVVAHFPMLARIVEVLGPISGTAGTSSGTITMFVLDSIQSNPVVVECPMSAGGGCCGPDEQKARISFLLKSFTGVKGGLLLADDLLSIVETLKAQTILGLLRSRSKSVAQDALTTLLSILQATTTDKEPFINPEFLESLLTSSNPIAAAIDLVAATIAILTVLGTGTGSTDPKFYVRPGIINFRRVTELADLFACFYRGLHPIDFKRMQSLVADCSSRSVGLPWPEIARLSTAKGSCGDRFDDLFKDFQLARGNNAPTMLNDRVGVNFMKIIGHDSVLTGNAVRIWKNAREEYRSKPDSPISFDIDFDDVKLGFYGQNEYMNSVEQRMLSTEFTDVDSKRFLNLGAVTWGELLVSSSSEPGLARGIEGRPGIVTVGGFSYQTPVQVLAALGCDKIIMITRPESSDPTISYRYSMNRLLGASVEELSLKYDLDNPNSTVSQGLRRQNGAVCGKWDDPDALDLLTIAQAGFDAPFYSSDACLLSLSADVVTGQERGCTLISTDP
jgi:hypothetical protein